MYSKVTISGKICTGKSTLFSQLQKALSWPSFSASQYFRDYAKIHGVSLQKAEEQNEHLTQDVDFGMRDKLVKEEHIILEGWMAGLMAEGMGDVLSILLTCNDDVRTKRFAKREGIALPDAAAKVQERESNLFSTLEKIYKRNDFVDPTKYALVIDTTNSPLEQTLRVVVEKLHAVQK